MINFKNLKLIGLASLLLSFNAYSLDSAKQAKISEMLTQFLDTSHQPNKGFETWIDEIMRLIAKEPGFEHFDAVLARIRNQKNLALVKLEIAKNRKLAPKFVQDMLGNDITKLSNILAARVKVRG